MSKLSIEELALAGKRCFLRADLNVPIADGKVTDSTRIEALLPTIHLGLAAGASFVVASHLGRPKGKPEPKYSLAPVARRLAELLGRPVPLAPDCVGPEVEGLAKRLKPGEILLLENLRFHSEEEANDTGFAEALARLADCYVNDAFAAAHRAHASIDAITRFLQPAAAGLLMRRELEALERIVSRPERPLIAILGGAKVSDKLLLVEELLNKVDRLLIGGGMAFTFLKAEGKEIGRSLVEPDLIETAKRVLAGARARSITLLLPLDAVVATSPDQEAIGVVPIDKIPPHLMGLDIGPATVARFGEALSQARTIVWNGPMGVFEKAPFAHGTVDLARAVADSGAFTVVGGGDSVAAVKQAGVAEKIGYISTAGGAFLEFLEGRTLPGVAALGERA
jgi:phosphoglycerate kinase